MKNPYPLSSFGINDKLTQIWSAYYAEEDNPLSPVYQKEVLRNVITFLALNPSFDPKTKKGNPTHGIGKIHPAFPMIDCNPGKWPNKFYTKYYKIREEVFPKEQWAAMDLLYIRDSHQPNIMGYFDKDEKGKNFIFSQAQITLDILKELRPKLVIVSNSFVDIILHEYNGFMKEYAPDANGVYRYAQIPFVMKESKFIGSPKLWQSDSDKSEKLRQNMYKAIQWVMDRI